jgi:hypothetical protein
VTATSPLGFAYAWHPHRDTWYSAPLAQVNYWMPVYEISADNAMAFHPEYFDGAVANDSPVYLSSMLEDVVAIFNDGTETSGDLVYVPPPRVVSART